jgi:triphosphatase
MAGVSGAAEIELKLKLPRPAIASLLRHPALAACKRGNPRRRRLVSTYFDTEDLRLAAAGIGLRLRRDGRKWIQTVKGPQDPRSGGALAARPEYEWPLGGARAMPAIDTTHLATTPWRRKLLKAARRRLVPVFTTDVRRTELMLALAGDTTATLAIDVGEIRAAGAARRIGVCEIEIELVSGRIDPLFALARNLAANLPLALEPGSKAARGVRLVADAKPRPQRAENAEFADRATAGDALASIVRACVRQIEQNAEGLVADDDPEWIHQMRIGTRRLRACLGLMRDFATDEAYVQLIDDTRWLARVLGPMRDLDVLAVETLPAVLAGARGGSNATVATTLRRLAMSVGRRRKVARAEARAAVTSPRFVRLVLTAGALATTPYFGAVPKSAAAVLLDASARKFARPVLAQRQRKLLREGSTLAQAPPEQRHAARIAAKKLRYASEFFADLFPRKRARAYRAALTRLQDSLGAQNDAFVAARLAREIAGADSVAAATLLGFAAAQSMRATGELATAWREFDQCKTFWERD